MAKRILIFFTIVIGLNCQAQEWTKPKKIRFKDFYEHKFSNTEFPQTLNNGFELTKVYAFDKKNIGVTYEKNSKPKGKLNVYIYPAEDGTENRLRNEYLTSMQSVANLTHNGLRAI